MSTPKPTLGTIAEDAFDGWWKQKSENPSGRRPPGTAMEAAANAVADAVLAEVHTMLDKCYLTTDTPSQLHGHMCEWIAARRSAR